MARRPEAIDVWCPACGAAPWTKCVSYFSAAADHGDDRWHEGGKAHGRRKYAARKLAHTLGFKSRPVPRNFRTARAIRKREEAMGW